tara:strand:+ start:553 stop:1425 length:873 start_codon:yes stop_codon:yes gene_type:complete
MIRDYKNYLILFSLALIWGSSFILMKRGLEEYSDFQVAALRLFIAFLSLTPFIYQAFKKLKKKYIFPLFISGVIGNGVPAFLFTKAQTSLESSFVGILNSLTPVFTLLLGFFFFKARISNINVFGVLLGFFGAAILYYSEISDFYNLNVDVLLVIIACLFYGFSINIIKKYLKELDSLHIAALSFLYVGPFAAYYIFNTDFINIVNTDSGFYSLIYIIILAILGTSISVVLFNKLIKESSAIFASSVTYLIPIVAIFWGWIENESIRNEHFLGVSIILFGVYLVNKKVST